MIVKTSQCDNRIGVRIPRDLAEKAGISVDSTVEVEEADDRFIIKPVGKKEYSLMGLFSGITPQSPHGEIDFGRLVGKELL